jgi:hypothetical protein
MNRTLHRALIGAVTVTSLVAVSACDAYGDEPTATDLPATDAPAATDAPPATEAPVETEAPAATDPPSTDAPAATEAPPATEAPVETEAPGPVAEPVMPTFEDFTGTQVHETDQLSPELQTVQARSAIFLDAAAETGKLLAGWFGFSILDSNGNGILDSGDTMGLTPQPVVDDRVEIGIDQGGPHFIAFFPPGTDFAVPPGTPINPTVDDAAGTWTLLPGQEIDVLVVVRSDDNPTPGFYDVDFGAPVMQPMP